MRQLLLRPQIHKYTTSKEFVQEMQVGEGDLILTNEFIFKPYFGQMEIPATVLYQEKYGMSEPTDQMCEAIYNDIKTPYKRVIAIGGGTVLDLAKLYTLKDLIPVIDMFDRKKEIVREKELILVPTTCGTGSEVTNISILEFIERKTKFGLAVDELYADHAVMIPELLEGLPYKFFAASSIDALIHAVESSVSPKATNYTRLFGYKAIDMILRSYRQVAEKGEMARIPLLGDFLEASNYAGIAFGNAGAGAVHAMSYPFGGKYHVPHGEANYTLFVKVFETYMSISGEGAIADLNKVMAAALDCKVEDVYTELAALLEKILPLKPLSAYGVTAEDIGPFTQNVMEKQGRLMGNNFVELNAERVAEIYTALL